MAALFQSAGDGEAEVERLLAAARGHFAARNPRKTIDALHAAQLLASQHGLRKRAVELRRALAIMAGGGRPKLMNGDRPGAGK